MTNELYIYVFRFIDWIHCSGKTLLAKSLSRSMIVLHSTDVAQSTVGQGEKAVLEAFENARTRSERVTVIFIDEFQALFTDRSSFSGSSRVTATLFQCMDNLTRWRKVDSSRRIIVLAATNTPWMIDNAFLRPGRFDRTVYVGLPSCEERKTILSLHLQTMQIDGDVIQLATDLALRSDGFSGADLAALCHAAAVECLLDCTIRQSSPLKVQERHFETVLEKKFVGPSSDPNLLAKIEDWRRS
jgi:SpoVK/Ycf46/Vps4 family AAA+-type ATPase